jgi:hypothetical protein
MCCQGSGPDGYVAMACKIAYHGNRAPADGCVSIGAMDFSLTADLYFKTAQSPPFDERR